MFDFFVLLLSSRWTGFSQDWQNKNNAERQGNELDTDGAAAMIEGQALNWTFAKYLPHPVMDQSWQAAGLSSFKFRAILGMLSVWTVLSFISISK